jgi:hypothetical protein
MFAYRFVPWLQPGYLADPMTASCHVVFFRDLFDEGSFTFWC